MGAAVGQYELEPEKSTVGGKIGKAPRAKSPELDWRADL
jgi:hypothetical protein